MLTDLDIRPRYVTGVDNILQDFVVPCLKASTSYSRASGYFSSSVLSLSWDGIRQLYGRSGSMRIVCSPSLAYADVRALQLAMQVPGDLDEEAALLADFRHMLSSSALTDSARALAALVVVGFLEIRIAVPIGSPSDNRARRVFHQKTGIFRDSHGNAVAFSGSMNETWAGLSTAGNIESIQAFASWQGDREAIRVALEERDFESLWTDCFPGVSVRTVPEVLRSEFITAADGVNVEQALESLAARSRKSRPTATPYSLRPHQQDVLLSWEAAGYRGIVNHATGAGKTITALHAINTSSGSVSCALVLVPSQLLLEQWEDAIARYSRPDTRVLLCGGGHTEWQRPGTLEAWTSKSDRFTVVVAVTATASKKDFIGRLAQGPHLMVVADEVHRLGSNQAANILTLECGRALGLSATPERAGDPTGTGRVLSFFGGILEPRYGIGDAIRDGFLSPYYYSASIVELTSEEQVQWDELSGRIRRLYVRENRSTADDDTLKRLLIRRAGIAKHAARKVEEAVEIVSRGYEPGQRWLLYCDTQEQMYAIQQELIECGLDAHVYFSDMPGDKKATLAYFESVGGVLVSIRCLDEGIDIPAASHALIIASSRNPREFIQRRGRVLRRAPGKELAYVYDLLVAPSSTAAATDNHSRGPLVGDVARAVEFAEYSINPHMKEHLRAIALQYGMTDDELRSSGFEVDELVDEEADDEP